MWQDDSLKQRIETDNTLPIRARVIAEFNVNAAVDPLDVGVYKYDRGSRPVGYFTQTDANFIEREELEELPSRLIDNANDKIKYYYSLLDCFKINRPRAGIIYPLFLTGELEEGNSSVYLETYKTSKRPRYYMHDRQNQFKYWTSAYYEANELKGVSSNTIVDGGYEIADAAPYIVYESQVDINKVVMKIQTYNGERRYENDPVADNKFTPKEWRVEYLTADNQWQTLYEFTNVDEIPYDGHIELIYGIVPPAAFADTFRLYGSVDFIEMLESVPEQLRHEGMAYLVGGETLYVWTAGFWVEQSLEINWHINKENDVFEYTVTELVNTDATQYFSIDGLRVVVKSMQQPGVPFELIELSPRLQADITNYVSSFNITKAIGFVENLPIGELSKDVANIQLINADGAFTEGNTDSIIYKYLDSTTKIVFYNEINDLAEPLTTKIIPIKTFYTQDWSTIDGSSGEMTLELEDHFGFFEEARVPELLMTNVSLTYIVSVLLDNIGYSNYQYIGFNDQNDIVIPYFFTGSEVKLTDILIDLAKSARCAMYFDEYNNFIMASKEHLSGADRQYDFVLTGENESDIVSNIINIDTTKTEFYNDGSIMYKPKTIQRGELSIDSGYYIGKNRTLGYKPTKLWSLENDIDKSYGSKTKNNSEFVLSAVVLESPLLVKQIPRYYNNAVQHNTIDIGGSAAMLARFGGYLYSNGEIIRYDAIEYNVPGYGNVWIESIDQWLHYSETLEFARGLYPTGRIRIWAEVVDDVVIRHGRGYFNTKITHHDPRGNNFWFKKASYSTMEQEYKYLFTPCDTIQYEAADLHESADVRWTGNGKGGIKADVPSQFIKSDFYTGESQRVKTSALVWRGPKTSEQKATSTLNYFRKTFDGNRLKRIGTRMRIIGEPIDDEIKRQRPNGGVRLYGTESAAGGLNWFTDNKRQGYFLEVIAMADDVNSGQTDCSNGNSYYHNIVCYKTIAAKNEKKQDITLPIKLWGATIPIALDSGKFVSEDIANNDTFNVIDIEVEMVTDNKFDIYLNGIRIGQAIDDVPKENNRVVKRLPANKEYGVFIRGDSHVMFENIWAVERSVTRAPDTVFPDVFGDVEVNNRFEEVSLDTVFRRYSIPGFIRQAYLRNLVTDGSKYRIEYEEFGAILRECYIVDADYTEAFPSFYSRILPTLESTPPFVISNEYLGPYGSEFIIFNTADKGIIIASGKATEVTINGIVMTQESEFSVTFDEFLEKYKNILDVESLTRKIKLSRRRDGLVKFNVETGDYLQTVAAAESILSWAINYLTADLITANAEIFANPMLQLGDILLLQNVKDTIVTPKRMVIDSIEYTYDNSGPTMSLGLREVL